jgi:hypothetical protein
MEEVEKAPIGALPMMLAGAFAAGIEGPPIYHDAADDLRDESEGIQLTSTRSRHGRRIV